MGLSTDQVFELASALTAVLAIWLNTKRRVEGWPIGMVSVVLAAWVYFKSGLYAETGLQGFFFISSLYGWWQWSLKSDQIKGLMVERIPVRQAFTGLVITLIGWWGLARILATRTDASQPILDSGIAAFSVLGQIWLARQWLENWWIWIVVNMASLGLYLYRELWYFSALYAILLVLALKGNRDWRKKTLSEEC